MTTRVSEENARQPRVENDAAPPRVEDSAIPRVDEPKDEVPDLCTPAEARKISAQMSKTPRVDTGLPRPMSVSCERMEPRYATRQQRQLRGSIATDSMLSVIKCSQANLAPQRLASRRFPLHYLCELANAVMDEETGKMLEYRQLIK